MPQVKLSCKAASQVLVHPGREPRWSQLGHIRSAADLGQLPAVEGAPGVSMLHCSPMIAQVAFYPAQSQPAEALGHQEGGLQTDCPGPFQAGVARRRETSLWDLSGKRDLCFGSCLPSRQSEAGAVRVNHYCRHHDLALIHVMPS